MCPRESKLVQLTQLGPAAAVSLQSSADQAASVLLGRNLGCPGCGMGPELPCCCSASAEPFQVGTLLGTLMLLRSSLPMPMRLQTMH